MSATTLPVAPVAAKPAEAAARRRQRFSPPHALRLCVQALALAGLTLYAAHAITGLGGKAWNGFCQDYLYNGLVVASAVLCLARALRVRAERGAWLVLGLGIAAWSAAELQYTFIADGVGSSKPVFRDVLYLAFYPASWVAMVMLLRSRISRLRPALWLDGLISALATAAIAAALLVEPVVHASGGYAAMAATSLAYALGDLMLLVFVVAVFGLTGWRPGKGWLLLGGGFALAAVADTVFLYQDAHGAYVEGGWLDVMWPAATLMLGFAAWQRGQRLGAIILAGWRVLLIPAVCAIVALGLLVLGNLHPVGPVAVGLATATLLVSVVRMAMLFAENLRLAALNSRQAMTDPLTGLNNRRQLVEDLRDAIYAATEEDPWTLIIFDLDGFKVYNDTFGHPAGDAMLVRLGGRLTESVAGSGSVYRLGGDEFCALLRPRRADHAALEQAAVEALCARREDVVISGSHGTAVLPSEASDVSRALLVADRRLYVDKRRRQRATSRR